MIRRLVLSSEGANRDGVRHKSVRGIPRDAMRERQTNDRGRNETREDLVPGDVRRRPEYREDSHGRPPFSIGHLRQIDERRNGAVAERRLSGLNLTVQSRVLFLSVLRKRDTEECQGGPAARDRVGPS